jgi:hypothetical protein
MMVDRVTPGERGRAMGTLHTARELGLSGGSILRGLCATELGYAAAWWTAAALAGAGTIARCTWPAGRGGERPDRSGAGRPAQRGALRSPLAGRRTRGVRAPSVIPPATS